MKIKNLLTAIFVGVFFSSIVGFGVIKYEFKLFTESEQGKYYYQDLGDYRFHYDVNRTGAWHSIDEIRNAKPKAFDYYNNWYWDNIYLIIVLLIVPFLSMFIFTYSVLQINTPNLKSYHEIIAYSLKNRVFVIIMTLYSFLYMVFLLKSKFLITFFWDTFKFSL